MAPRSGPRAPGAASLPPRAGDDEWAPQKDGEAYTLQSLLPSSALEEGDNSKGNHRRHPKPSQDLKTRLSRWGEALARRVDDGDEEGSEYELLMDPNLPEEYAHHRHHANDGFRPSQDSASFNDDDPTKETRPSGGDGEAEEDSPYPEVRAAVRNYDEDLPCNTVRAWTIGLSLIFLGASMNTLFSLRSPSISLGSLIAQVVAWPIGHGWAAVMPDKTFTTFGIRWSLNPGPFNIKEHAIIVVMASVSFSVAYATDIILAQLVFYKQDFGIVFQLLLTISTQSLGYGIAGMMRRFLGKWPWNALVYHGWKGPNLLQIASIPRRHDLAREPGVGDADERNVREERCSRSDRPGRHNASLQMVRHCHLRRLRLLLPPRVSGSVPQLLCIRDMDGSK